MKQECITGTRGTAHYYTSFRWDVFVEPTRETGNKDRPLE